MVHNAPGGPLLRYPGSADRDFAYPHLGGGDKDYLYSPVQYKSSCASSSTPHPPGPLQAATPGHLAMATPMDWPLSMAAGLPDGFSPHVIAQAAAAAALAHHHYGSHLEPGERLPEWTPPGVGGTCAGGGPPGGIGSHHQHHHNSRVDHRHHHHHSHQHQQQQHTPQHHSSPHPRQHHHQPQHQQQQQQQQHHQQQARLPSPTSRAPPQHPAFSATPRKENGMMDGVEAENEGAINLSTTTTTKDPPSNHHHLARQHHHSPSTPPDMHNGDTSSPRRLHENGEASSSTASALHQQTLQQGGTSTPAGKPPASPLTPPIAAKPGRKLKATALEAAGGPPPLLMMAPQQPLSPQQMQQLLQQQVLSPGHLQQLMQQQSLVLQHHTQQELQGQVMQQLNEQLQTQQKLQEQVMQQLNEQLQVNIVQQSQLMQQQAVGGKKVDHKQMASQLQQLQLQQQQIIQQMQLQQRQFLLSQGLLGMTHMPPGHVGLSTTEMQQLWKEITGAHIPSEDAAKGISNGIPTSPNGFSSQQHMGHSINGLSDGFGPPPGGILRMPSNHGNGDANSVNNGSTKHENETSGAVSAEKRAHALYGHGVCKWPGCDTPCEDTADFLVHINEEHQLDDRSTAQARVQQQVVSQLELQLKKERERLTAMMSHLHMRKTGANNAESGSGSSSKPVKTETVTTPTTPKPTSIPVPRQHHVPVTLPPPPPVSVPPPMSLVISTPSQHLPLVNTPTILSAPPTISASHTSYPTHSPPHTMPPSPPTSSGPGPIRRRVSDKCNLPISAEIQRNREFYRTTDVRPPFTYASLIRQAIIESPERQLTLNEIYQWFQSVFAFFRKNQATWKAIVDSPHRQLTLNEIYQWFQKSFLYFRQNEATWKNAVRHNLSLHKCFMRVENVKGAVWTVDEIEFYKRRPQKMSGNVQLKAGSSVPQNPSLYGESLNASLRAALAESNLPMLNSMSMPMEMDSEYAEDLSMSGLQRQGSYSNEVDLSRSHSSDMDFSRGEGTEDRTSDNLKLEHSDVRLKEAVHLPMPGSPDHPVTTTTSHTTTQSNSSSSNSSTLMQAEMERLAASQEASTSSPCHPTTPPTGLLSPSLEQRLAGLKEAQEEGEQQLRRAEDLRLEAEYRQEEEYRREEDQRREEQFHRESVLRAAVASLTAERTGYALEENGLLSAQSTGEGAGSTTQEAILREAVLRQMKSDFQEHPSPPTREQHEHEVQPQGDDQVSEQLPSAHLETPEYSTPPHVIMPKPDVLFPPAHHPADNPSPPSPATHSELLAHRGEQVPHSAAMDN